MDEDRRVDGNAPHFEEVQAHYDLSDDFFGLFQDPSRTYSCAFFERDDMTLEEAQMAKIDLALGKLDLQPGMTLLDIGCGWGSVMKRAVEKYDVNVVGLTLSKNQCVYCQAAFGRRSTPTARGRCSCAAGSSSTSPSTASSASRRSRRSRRTRYAAFFETCYRILPERRPDGAADDHGPSAQALAASMGIPITMTDLKFMRFIAKEIFPGGAGALRRGHRGILTAPPGFRWSTRSCLNEHYVRTLDTWATNLEAAHDEAVAATSEEVYERYMRYLTGCADFFRRGISELGQFTLTKG